MTGGESRVINAATEHIKRLFAGEYSGHDFYHSLRVYKTAADLARSEGADMFTVCLAALLHDADDIKLSPQTHAHKARARAFMQGCGLPCEFQERVCLIISEVAYRGGDSVVPTSIEGKCVQDADRLDALGAIGIARAFAYGGSRGRALYDPDAPPLEDLDEAAYRAAASSTINHFYEKLFRLRALMNTDAARRAAAARERFMREYVDEFMREWEGEA